MGWRWDCCGEFRYWRVWISADRWKHPEPEDDADLVCNHRYMGGYPVFGRVLRISLFTEIQAVYYRGVCGVILDDAFCRENHMRKQALGFVHRREPVSLPLWKEKEERKEPKERRKRKLSYQYSGIHSLCFYWRYIYYYPLVYIFILFIIINYIYIITRTSIGGTHNVLS